MTKISHKSHQITLRMGKGFNPEQIFGLLKNTKENWIVTSTGMKLDLASMPVTWYKDLLTTVEWLIPEKKKKKEKVKKATL